MAASQAFLAGGLAMQMDDGAGNYATILEVTNAVPPSETWTEIEVTNHLSPNKAKEIILGFVNSGNFQIDVNWIPGDPTQQAAGNGIWQVFTTAAKRNYKMILNDAAHSTESWAGYLTKRTPDTPLEKQAQLKMTGRVSGITTMTAT